MVVNGGTFDSNKATSSGGGIYNAKSLAALNSGVLEARNSTFKTNQAISTDGGGIYNSTGAALTLDNDTFSKNTAGGFGGGIYNRSGASVTVTTSLINDGTATTLGGGIANFGTIVSMDNTLIQGNKATSSGGAGGGVFNVGTANITNTTIKSNSTAGQGGGIYNGFNGTTPGTLTLRNNSLVSGNRAATGGGIYNATGATAKVGGSTMISNRLTSSSGVGPDAWGNYTSEGFNTLYKAAGSTGFSAANGDTIIFE
jgi:predicted outer membrane repeat protein